MAAPTRRAAELPIGRTGGHAPRGRNRPGAGRPAPSWSGSQCLEISTDEGKSHARSYPRVPSADRPPRRQAGDGVKCIAPQRQLRPTPRVISIARACCGHGSEAQAEVADANRPHEEEGGSRRRLGTGQSHGRTRCHDHGDTDRGAEPSHRLRIDRRHSRSVASGPSLGRCCPVRSQERGVAEADRSRGRPRRPEIPVGIPRPAQAV